MRFGVTTDYDYSAEHVRQKLQIWSGPFMSTYEGDAYSRTGVHAGFVVTTYNGDKVIVDCPSPRDESNYETVDRAIDAAMNLHYDTDVAKRRSTLTDDMWKALPAEAKQAWVTAVQLTAKSMGVLDAH